MLLLLGCGGSLDPDRLEPARSTVTEATSEGTTQPPVPQGPVVWTESQFSDSAAPNGQVWVTVADAPKDARCPSQAACEVWVGLHLTSGLDAEVWLHHVTVQDGQGGGFGYELASGDVEIGAAKNGKLRIDLRRPGNYAIVLNLLRPDGTSLETAPVTVRIRDAVRDEAVAACDACRGVWQTGMLGTSCNCRTRDMGTECRDGLACEGECETKKTEEVVVAGVRGRRWVGVCSEFRRRAGCHSRIPDGALLAPPLPIQLSYHTPIICSD